MKKLIFLILFMPGGLFAGTITITHSDGRSYVIKDSEIKIVEDSVMDSFDWLVGAWEGKVNSCGERIINMEISHSVQNEEQIPKRKEDIIKKRLSRPGYKNRRQREKENIIPMRTP